MRGDIIDDELEQMSSGLSVICTKRYNDGFTVNESVVRQNCSFDQRFITYLAVFVDEGKTLNSFLLKKGAQLEES